MGSRALEITIISAEGLMLSPTQRVKRNSFVTVGADRTEILSSTTMDLDGGSYPTWNDKIFVDIPIHSRYLVLEAQCRTKYSGDRALGRVNIPVADFVGGFTPPNYLHFLSYRLRDEKGNKNGIINISIRVNSTKGDNGDNSHCSQPNWLTVPYKQFSKTTTTTTSVVARNKVFDSGIVTGVPIWPKHT